MANLIPTVTRKVHPFVLEQIDVGGTSYITVHYHSRLFTGMKLEGKYLSFKKIGIKGLDFLKKIPSTFPGKNLYCVLEITISELNPTKAEIVWVEGDQSANELNPVEFSDASSLKQSKARIIIGVLVFDAEEIAGGPSPSSGGVSTEYISQFVHNDLIMCNMVFDGVPIIYPVPFAGGRLNF